jgi:tetratricopeptide (TPR) repeat protein
MAPEQAQAKPGIDARTDVYGLGAILYELLTGRPPFRADSALQTLRQVVDAEPARPRLLNPAVLRDLETICLKCLEKEPSRRYPNAEALADDLLRFRDGQPVLARPIGSLGRSWRWCRRNPILAGLTAVLTLVLVGGLSGIIYHWYQADALRREAVVNAAETRQVLSELIQSSPTAPLIEYYPRPPSIEPLLKAAEHCRDLLQKNPEDTELRIALTNVYGRLGTRYAQLGQPVEEAAVYRQASELWESPPPQVAAQPEYRYWLATTRYWRGSHAFDQEEIGAGYQWYLSSDAVWEELAEEQPDNLDILGKGTLCRHDLTRIADMDSFADACRPSLEAVRTQLEQEFHDSRGSAAGPNRTLRKRLALICLALGDAHQHMNSAVLARTYWKQAADLYATLDAAGHPPATTEDALLLALAGYAYSRLATGTPPDANYARAVSAFERAGKRLDAVIERNPDPDWVRDTLQRVYCSLARCHSKSGRPDLAEKTYQEHLRGLVDYLEAKRKDPEHVMTAEMAMCQLVHGLSGAGLRSAALSVARRAGELTTEYAAFPLHYPELDFRMANYAWELSRGLRDLGDAAAALQQAELARKLWADYWQAHPEAYTGGMQVAQAWVEVGKAQQDLGRIDEAWNAFQEAASVQRRVLDRAPAVQYHRVYLGRCYDFLVECGIRRGDWAGAADALRERELLWPADPKRLMEVSDGFRELAEKMTRAQTKTLSANEEKQRGHYVSESDRIKQAADAVVRRAGNDGS